MREKWGRGLHTFLVLQAAASEINHLNGTFCRMFEQDVLCTININTGPQKSRRARYLWLQITMDDAVVPHQG